MLNKSEQTFYILTHDDVLVLESISKTADKAFWEFLSSRCIVINGGPKSLLAESEDF